MPKVLLDFMGYTFYFYSREDGEPVHIHVSRGNPNECSAKFWIKRDGIELEHNKGNIPKKDLKRIQKYICANRE
ncbi:MAG: DUF4160 domain-containing protein, partial [Clostridiales bacterium]|nr:DUF4160 domain-containing protein [Clostridiales bacterium]